MSSQITSTMGYLQLLRDECEIAHLRILMRFSSRFKLEVTGRCARSVTNANVVLIKRKEKSAVSSGNVGMNLPSGVDSLPIVSDGPCTERQCVCACTCTAVRGID